MSKRDIRALLERARRELPRLFIDEAASLSNWELVKTREIKVFIKDGVPFFIELEGRLIPSIYAAEACKYPKVVVDTGAIYPIVRGADVMAPGVRVIEGSMEAGDVMAIAEEGGGRVIAVGVALMSRKEVLEAKRGRALRVLHRVGDEAWKLGSPSHLGALAK
ncbi:MAG: hypothetical protein N3H31_01820 [Candidatus Nezhaarchaeota archaeon]|nr:hypothetical protein [Candidatus Nezhaarchaeota archaeon]